MQGRRRGRKAGFPLSQIVESGHERTYTITHKLAIYRNATERDARRRRRGEQRASDQRRSTVISRPISVAVGSRSGRYRRMSAAARVTVVHASAAPKLVEIAPSPRNAETHVENRLLPNGHLTLWRIYQSYTKNTTMRSAATGQRICQRVCQARRRRFENRGTR